MSDSCDQVRITMSWREFMKPQITFYLLKINAMLVVLD